jgi:hypothetical protein
MAAYVHDTGRRAFMATPESYALPAAVASVSRRSDTLQPNDDGHRRPFGRARISVHANGTAAPDDLHVSSLTTASPLLVCECGR